MKSRAGFAYQTGGPQGTIKPCGGWFLPLRLPMWISSSDIPLPIASPDKKSPCPVGWNSLKEPAEILELFDMGQLFVDIGLFRNLDLGNNPV